MTLHPIVTQAVATVTSVPRHHVIAGIISAVVSSLIVGGVHLATPAQQLVVTQSGKPNPNAWGELSQVEVDALTMILKSMPTKYEVGIFCATKDCEDLALDFDNAFESAHWKSGVERPLMDSNFGINVGPPDAAGKALANAIDKATAGRIKPGLLPAQILGENRLVLVISKKVTIR
jgi:hypothetical protein